MTVVTTRNVSYRFRGMLASCMLEISSGVYTSPNMEAGERKRLWGILEQWYSELGESGSIFMIWKDNSVPEGQKILNLGHLPIKIVEHDGLFLSYSPEKEFEDP